MERERKRERVEEFIEAVQPRGDFRQREGAGGGIGGESLWVKNSKDFVEF